MCDSPFSVLSVSEQFLIEDSYRVLAVGLRYAEHQGDLGCALVNDLEVDACCGEGGGCSCHDTDGLLHCLAYYHDDGKILLDLNGFSHRFVLEAVDDDLLLLGGEEFLSGDDGNGIDTGGHMLDGDAFLRQYLQKGEKEAHLMVHEILGYRYGKETSLGSDTRYQGVVVGTVGNDLCTACRGVIGISDVNGDTSYINRVQGLLVED